MFDWARGSMLKQFIEQKVFLAEWTRNAFLKNWHASWLLGLIELTPEMCVLDVGSARPKFMKYIHDVYGCEVHALDAPSEATGKSHFGFSKEVFSEFPNVTMHVGLAGEDLLPAEKFDLITCISTLEHTYDHNSPLLASRPMPHLHALRDMVRMLKPGGTFLMNWDMYLDNMPQKFGYEFEVDYQIMRACGLQLMSNRRRVRNVPYIFSHPETLFFDPIQVLGFKHGQLRRGTAINVLWRKPGRISRIRLSPRPELDALYFPDEETRPNYEPELDCELTTEQIDANFRNVFSRVSDVLGRTDVDGAKTPESLLG